MNLLKKKELGNHGSYFYYLYICLKQLDNLLIICVQIDMKRVKLKVMGMSYSQTQSGAYALLLIEENGDRRIPIIIGGFEAQAIVIKLENLEPPRPLTHDLFKKFADQFNIAVTEVMIHKLEDGVFFSRLVCTNGDQ